MALPFSPHRVTVQSFAQAKSGRGVANQITYTPTYSLDVSISAKDPTETYAAMSIDLKRPHRMMMDLHDASKLKTQDRIAWGSRLFTVATPPRISEHGLVTDHASVMLEEIYE